MQKLDETATGRWRYTLDSGEQGWPPWRAATTDAEVLFLEPIAASESRRKMAETARFRIIEALGFDHRRKPAAWRAAQRAMEAGLASPADDVDVDIEAEEPVTASSDASR